MQTEEARQLLSQGRLADVMAGVTADVRSSPAEVRHRVFLFQLLCLTGQWERAMTQLNVVVDLKPNDADLTLMVRAGAAAIQCEAFRAAVFRGEQDPLVIGQPAEWAGWMIHANRLLATGHPDAADELRAKALEAAPAIPGTINGQPFQWLADADVRFGPMLEAIIDGRYFWVPMQNVRTLTVDAPVDLRDLVWSPARIVWANGGDTVALLPTRYPGSENPADPLACLARKTEWVMRGLASCGVGQRTFTTDQGDVAILETRTIQFDLPEAADVPPADGGSAAAVPEAGVAMPGVPTATMRAATVEVRA